MAQTPGCVLLDVDAGPSTNRTVYTFVGRPEDVVEGALNAARTAFRFIDMSKHKGEGGSRPAAVPKGVPKCCPSTSLYLAACGSHSCEL